MISREELRRALRLLGKEALVLVVHDGSFPSRAEDDIGRGSPYGHGAHDFIEFLCDLGFDGLHLGPQGITSRGNPSPYDGTLFSKSPLAIALDRVASETTLLPANDLADLAAHRPTDRDRVSYEWTYDHHAAMRARVHAEFLARGPAAMRAAFASFVQKAGPAWLDADAAADEEPDRDKFCFEQFLVHEQHAARRREMHSLGMKLYGDWQIGLSPRDARAHRVKVIDGYAMGAPPSRTNPEGQPWGYPLLHPSWLDADAIARDPEASHTRRFVEARLAKAVSEYDSLRLDHPHGWVDPWAYRTDTNDHQAAVRNGARLFGSPDLPDHPLLAQYAIAKPDDLDRATARYSDPWVRSLEPSQIDAYARAMDLIIAGVGPGGASNVVCEVLSTQPRPLGYVMERHHLGRFRVTQKSDPSRADDVYRSDRAEARDWIMLGNHDTDPMWRVVQRWSLKIREARAQGLAQRLLGSGDHQEWVAELMAHEPALVQAELADLLVSRAAHVLLFFPDLFGMTDVYNVPGLVSDANWRLRVPHDYRTRYAHARAQHRALDLPYALALAMRARGLHVQEPELFETLRSAAARPLPLLRSDDDAAESTAD